MEEKEVEFLFTKKYIDVNSILQLKDGKLLFYDSIGGYNIILYNQKTFQKLFVLDIDELIKKLEEMPKVEFYEEEDDDDDMKFWKKCRWSRRYSRNYGDKINIKELDNGLILIGYNKYLIELNYFENNYSSKVVKKFKEIILDILELSDKKFIIIANDNIKEVIKEKGKYVITKKYSFEENWRMNCHRSTPDIEYSDFSQYFCSNILPDDKLLLNSFSSELFDYTGCSSHPTEQLTFSKIIFIDLKNFKEITSTKTFNKILRYIFLENIIIIQVYKKLILYDINSLKHLRDIQLEQYYNFFKHNNNLIAFSQEEKNNNISIFKVENNDLIKVYIIQKEFPFSKRSRWNNYSISDYIKNSLLILNNKRIIFIYGYQIYILKLNID